MKNIQFDPNELERLSKLEIEDLKIERYSPEGNVENVSSLSIHFNHPMISISSLTEMEKMNPIANLEPKIPGKWVWKGTQNLQFESEHRFPKSTTYRVSIKKGIKSISGCELKKDFSFEFSTNTLKIKRFHPQLDTIKDLQPIFFLEFDQRIDKESLLSTIEVISENYQNAGKLVLVSEEQLKNNFQYEHLVSISTQGNWIAFTTCSPLNRATSYQIRICGGSSSAEGPMLTSQSKEYKFNTYLPLYVSSVYPTNVCAPNSSWKITFNNEIDNKSLSRNVFEIEPKVSNLRFRVKSNSIFISSSTIGNTKYTLKISELLKDIYGQHLLVNESIEFNVGNEEIHPVIRCPRGMIIFNPTDLPVYNAVIKEYKQVVLKIYQVSPSDYLDSPLSNHKDVCSVGKIVFYKTFTFETNQSRVNLVSFPLLEYLQFPSEKLGHLLISLEAERTSFSNNDQNRDINWSWFQSTKMGVCSWLSQNENLECYANVSNLLDGSPISDVSLKLTGSSEVTMTNKIGIAKLKNFKFRNQCLIAQSGNDSSFLIDLSHSPKSLDKIQFFAITDRNLYRPNETVHMKVYFRKLKFEKGSLNPHYCSGIVKWKATDSCCNTILNSSSNLNEFGSFDINFKIPDTASLGISTVQFEYNQEQFFSRYKVEEFRRPEFEATTSFEQKDNHISSINCSGGVTLKTKATYFSGEALSGANVDTTIYSNRVDYVPPGRSKYRFGNKKSLKSELQWSFNGKTDINGENLINLEYAGNYKKLPYPLSIKSKSCVKGNKMTPFFSHNNV